MLAGIGAARSPTRIASKLADPPSNPALSATMRGCGWSVHMTTMTTEYTPWERALDRISRSIAEHQPVRREGAVGSTCRNPLCNGVIFLTIKDRYNHQAVVLANDLQRDRDFYMEMLREEAHEEGREFTPDDLAGVLSDFLILAPGPLMEVLTTKDTMSNDNTTPDTSDDHPAACNNWDPATMCADCRSYAADDRAVE